MRYQPLGGGVPGRWSRLRTSVTPSTSAAARSALVIASGRSSSPLSQTTPPIASTPSEPLSGISASAARTSPAMSGSLSVTTSASTISAGSSPGATARRSSTTEVTSEASETASTASTWASIGASGSGSSALGAGGSGSGGASSSAGGQLPATS